MADEFADSSTMFERYYANSLRTGDTKETDNPIDNIMCRDILINVIFGCKFGGFDCARKTSASNIMLLSTIVTVSQIKFTLKCLINSLLYLIGLLVLRNKRQYVVWFIFIKLLFI